MRRRYRAEARFRAYGIIALLVTAVFLVVLIADIVRKGLPAFMQHSVVLDVAVKAESIDPGNKRTDACPASRGTAVPAPIVVRAPVSRAGAGRSRARSLQPIRAGDYFPLTRDALKAGIPGIEGRREREPRRLLSSGAADILRDQVSADAGLVGKTVVPLLLSDNADLYFKGAGTNITRAQGGASPPRAIPAARSRS